MRPTSRIRRFSLDFLRRLIRSSQTRRTLQTRRRHLKMRSMKRAEALLNNRKHLSKLLETLIFEHRWRRRFSRALFRSLWDASTRPDANPRQQYFYWRCLDPRSRPFRCGRMHETFSYPEVLGDTRARLLLQRRTLEIESRALSPRHLLPKSNCYSNIHTKASTCATRARYLSLFSVWPVKIAPKCQLCFVEYSRVIWANNRLRRALAW